MLATTGSITYERYWWTPETIEDPAIIPETYNGDFPFRLVRYGNSYLETVTSGNGVCPSVLITYATNDTVEDPEHRGRLCSFVEKVGSWYNIYYEFTLYSRPDGLETKSEDEQEKGRLLAREKTKCTNFPCQPKQRVEVLDPLGLTGVFADGGLVEALLNTPNSSLMRMETAICSTCGSAGDSSGPRVTETAGRTRTRNRNAPPAWRGGGSVRPSSHFSSRQVSSCGPSCLGRATETGRVGFLIRNRLPLHRGATAACRRAQPSRPHRRGRDHPRRLIWIARIASPPP